MHALPHHVLVGHARSRLQRGRSARSLVALGALVVPVLIVSLSTAVAAAGRSNLTVGAQPRAATLGPAHAGPALVGASSAPSSNSDCSPTTDAATSGGSPATLEASATEVASGTVDGQAWSLWSRKGESGATALENGGLVLDGAEFGLCPGYPNPAEMEMLDMSPDAIVYGVIGYPGLAKVDLYVGSVGSFTPGAALPAPAVRVVGGVSFFIGALPKSACSYQALELNSTSPGVSAEHNLGFGGAGAGQGYYISDNPGNSGGCVAGKIDPISFSQGIWQLPPGQFQTGGG